MKRILKTLSKKWPEYLLEILVLIIGIYGAFALEEWNEDVQQSKKQETIRKNLIVEFEANLEQLELAIAAHEQSIIAGKEFIRIISNGERISATGGDSLLAAFYTNWSYDPINGALRTSISSGDIHLLENDELLQLLFSWEDIVADATEDEDHAIARTLYTLQHYNPNIEWANVIRNGALEKSKDSSNYTTLFSDPEFKYFVTTQSLYIHGAKSELELVKEANMRILELLKDIKSWP